MYVISFCFPDEQRKAISVNPAFDANIPDTGRVFSQDHPMLGKHFLKFRTEFNCCLLTGIRQEKNHTWESMTDGETSGSVRCLTSKEKSQKRKRKPQTGHSWIKRKDEPIIEQDTNNRFIFLAIYPAPDSRGEWLNWSFFLILTD